ncbi:FYVE [Durusdinium trenchii]|uniref:RhoGEF and PH domain-containing protein 6 (Zinc finger FYVE domain-containing protein 24) n=1 Tax=Durusdinium trenchii TaxID=1381693 RepID=A0ABP0PY43_9DINO
MEARSLRSSSFVSLNGRPAVGDGAWVFPSTVFGLELGRSRSSTWAPARSSSRGSRDDVLDEWLFPVKDPAAHRTWSTDAAGGGRPRWLREVQQDGGVRGWLLQGLELSGMEDKNYLLGLRWLSGVALPITAERTAEWRRRRRIAEEIEKDLPRTFPGHPNEEHLTMASRDILRMLCCARNVSVGYTQGLNFTAAVLSCAMARDDAFWCLTALAESVAAHFMSNDMLQGAVADCECIDWLAGELDPQLAALGRACEGYSSVIFARPLCTLLACCGLPVDATLQCWRAILHSTNPRIFLLRSITAFLLAALQRQTDPPAELGDLMEALEKTFQGTYDAQVVLAAATESVESVPDSVVLEKLKQIEDRLQSKHANRSDAQREAHEAQQAQRLRQLVLEDVGVRQSLLKDMQAAWRGAVCRTRPEVSQMDFLLLLPAEDLQGVKSSTWEAFLSTIFDDLDVSRRGLVPLKHALIALALMLGDTPLERICALFSMLEVEGRCCSEATGQQDAAAQWLASNNVREHLDQETFIKALLALPSLALATVDTDLTGSFSISFTSSSCGTLLPVAPKWVPDVQESSCQLCAEYFTCYRRRHHCRACGRLVCRPCSRQKIALSIIGYLEPVRVCDDCFSVLSP